MTHAVAGEPEGDKVASSAPSAAAGELRASEPTSRTTHDETQPPRDVCEATSAESTREKDSGSPPSRAEVGTTAPQAEVLEGEVAAAVGTRTDKPTPTAEEHAIEVAETGDAVVRKPPIAEVHEEAAATAAEVLTGEVAETGGAEAGTHAPHAEVLAEEVDATDGAMTDNPPQTAEVLSVEVAETGGAM